jgi:hypothetical protein
MGQMCLVQHLWAYLLLWSFNRKFTRSSLTVVVMYVVKYTFCAASCSFTFQKQITCLFYNFFFYSKLRGTTLSYTSLVSHLTSWHSRVVDVDTMFERVTAEWLTFMPCFMKILHGHDLFSLVFSWNNGSRPWETIFCSVCYQKDPSTSLQLWRPPSRLVSTGKKPVAVSTENFNKSRPKFIRSCYT